MFCMMTANGACCSWQARAVSPAFPANWGPFVSAKYLDRCWAERGCDDPGDLLAPEAVFVAHGGRDQPQGQASRIAASRAAAGLSSYVPRQSGLARMKSLKRTTTSAVVKVSGAQNQPRSGV